MRHVIDLGPYGMGKPYLLAIRDALNEAFPR
jgi:hypothetical protein